MLKVHLGRFVKDDASLEGKEEVRGEFSVLRKGRRREKESAVSSLPVSQSPYLWQLVILFIKLGKINPECVWLADCLINIHRLHSLRVRVDDLGERGGEGECEGVRVCTVSVGVTM